MKQLLMLWTKKASFDNHVKQLLIDESLTRKKNYYVFPLWLNMEQQVRAEGTQNRNWLSK